MLVLSRKVSESIKIGDGITVVINRISGNRVTLGIEAPRNMRIIRGELKPFETEEPADVAKPTPVAAKAAPLTVSITADGVYYAPRRAR